MLDGAIDLKGGFGHFFPGQMIPHLLGRQGRVFVTIGMKEALHAVGQRNRVARFNDFTDSPTSNALAQRSHRSRDDRSTMRDGLMEHTALRGELGIRKHDNLRSVENPLDFLLGNESGRELDG